MLSPTVTLSIDGGTSIVKRTPGGSGRNSTTVARASTSPVNIGESMNAERSALQRLALQRSKQWFCFLLAGLDLSPALPGVAQRRAEDENRADNRHAVTMKCQDDQPRKQEGHDVP